MQTAGMASDDEDELAALRAARAARTGQATLSDLRRRAGTAEDTAAVARSSTGRGGGTQAEDEPVVVDEHNGEDAALRDYLPVAFGKQKAPPPRPSTDPHQHSKRQEPSIGPPRPPSTQQQQQQQPAIGPPRPPAVGPPRPPQQPAAAEPSSRAAEIGAAGTMGPPRPRTGGWMTVEELIGPQPPGSDTAAAAAEDGGADDDAGQVGPSRPPADAEGDEADVGPPRPPKGSDDDDDDDMDEDDADLLPDDPYHLPINHEVTLQGQGRAVTCLDIDPSGSRLVTGSLDYTVRMFDFSGMKSDLRSFRDFTPSDGHPVLSLSWSPTGDAFLVVMSSAQPRIYDREGLLRGECVRGDMYIRDMKNTKGHVTGCTYGVWHPTDKFTAATSSEDGTVRIWDTHNILQKTVVKPSTPSAARVGVSTVAYNTTGKLLAAGLTDGTLQVWGVGGKFGTSAAVGVVLPPAPQMVEKQGWTYVSRPNQVLRGAHETQNDISSIAFSKDDVLMASRGADNTLKLWDLRAFKRPLAVWDNLDTNYANTSCCFSPDDRLLLTGIAAERRPASSEGGEGGGAVVMFDVKELKEVRRVGMPSHVAAVKWHPKINQIFVGIGDKRGGSTHVLYDTTYSRRGALMAVGRAPRVANPFDLGLSLAIKTPHALPMFREDAGRKRGREKARHDALKSRKPDPGATAGMGRAGRIGSTGGTLLTQHLLKTRGKLVSTDAELDPREAILRHADKEDDISMLTAAYAKTQPQPIFAEPEPEEDEDE